MVYYPDPDQLVVFLIFRSIFAPICISVHSFLIFVFIYSRNYRQSFHNWLTTMMAFADVIVGIGIFARISVFITGYPRTPDGYNRSICLAFAVPQFLGILWSQSIVSHMARDRLRAITNPTAYGNISFKTESMKIIFEWIVFGVIVLLVAYLSLPHGHSVQCSTGSIASHFFLYLYIFTGTLKGILVSLIYYRALKQLKAKTTMSTKAVGHNIHNAVFRRVSKLLFFYISLSVLPLIIVFVCLILNLDENLIAYGALAVAMLSEVFSVSSFVVLSWNNREIQVIIHRVFCRETPMKIQSVHSVVQHSRVTVTNRSK